MDGEDGEDPPSSPIPFELRASSLLNGSSCTKTVRPRRRVRSRVRSRARGVRAFDIPRRHPRD